MRFRKFGRLDWQVSALGFGAMRLPIRGDEHDRIDEEQATRMVRYAIDHGVNYVDTAYAYHREESERFLGRALQDGYRERIRLATKLPCWKVETAADFDRFLGEQLQKLQTERIDFYLLHSLNGGNWPKMRDLGVVRWAEGAIADGRIGYLGFSFHDEYQAFQEIVDATDLWTFCQMQYNFMDVDYQAGTKGLRYAAGKGLAVVVMEPIRGGKLAKKVPPAVQEIWDSAPQRRTPAEWCLQWVWNQPEVSVVLSGMSALEQVEQNEESAGRSGPGTLSQQELALFDRVRAKYEELCPIPCTDCQYCLPCPNGVNIPRVFEIYNDLMIYGEEGWANWAYNIALEEEQRADRCIECGECLEKCPQTIEIPEWLAKAHKVLCKEQS